MLSALGVLAVIGSALAFKAHKAYTGNLRCAESTIAATTTATIAAGNCTARFYSVTNQANGAIRYCTLANDNSLPCEATTFVRVSQ